MKPQLRQAYDALDQARGGAYRRFSAKMKNLKAEGYDFDHAFSIACWGLLYELMPYYEAIKCHSVWNTCEVINDNLS